RITVDGPPSASLLERLDLAHMLRMLPVEKLGDRCAERLAGTYGSLDALLRANPSGWTGAGASAAGAENLAAYLADPEARAHLEAREAARQRLLAAAPEQAEAVTGPLGGRPVVLTRSPGSVT